MYLSFEPYEPRHVDAVKAFNERIRLAMPQGPSTRTSVEFSDQPARRGKHPELYEEYFLAREGDDVRGGYILKWQPFQVNGTIEPFPFCRLPLSEGIVNRAFGMVGMLLLKDARRRSPQILGLGGGGLELRFNQLLSAMNWRLVDCPFYFYVLNPYQFLRGLVHLRKSPGRRLILDTLALTGLGSLGVQVAHWWRRTNRLTAFAVEEVDSFGNWADHIWETTRGRYALVALRNASVLNVLYPATDLRFIRLKISVKGEVVGWAVLLNTLMKEDNFFGNLRVGSLVDCLALPGHESMVVSATRSRLAAGAADLIVTNQLAANWGSALKDDGFLQGPSNFIFCVSPRLAERLGPFPETAARIHMNRGDNDGPIHL